MALTTETSAGIFRRRPILRFAVRLCALALLAACSGSRSEVVIFHAGSLAPLIKELAQRFESNHPDTVILAESSGSLDAIRKVTELGKNCDLAATADELLVERFLVPRGARGFLFLGNEMVLATARDDLLSGAEEQRQWKEDWYERLFSGGYSYGTSDPNRDPAGYYARLVWKLAEIHYNRPGLYRRFVGRFQESWLRPKSSDLLALLETGNLDFAFLYKSAALQNNLRFVALPPEVSLGEDSYADFYAQAFVQVQGETPESSLEITGRPIRYSIALLNPSNAQAQQFLRFFLSQESQNLYRELGYAVVKVREIS